MNALNLSLASIKSRPLEAWLCVAAAASGIALLCMVFLLSQALETGLMRNARGIDVIVGAKGSPLQLVLSSIYHLDVPNGNIEMDEADKIIHNPQVKQAIPLALGDNYQGWRMVGTTPDYLALYHAQFESGHVWNGDFESVVGADTKLALGTEFAARHGFAADSDDVHNFHLYKVVGILKPTGTVLDRMILSSVSSVQQLHSHPDAGDPDAADELKLGHQITALLIKVKSPVSVLNLPREINHSTDMLAASPAYIMARFSQSIGLGRNVIMGLGAGFILLSALMLLASLAASLAARRFDLGVLRVLGASPFKISATIMTEALILSAGGAILGICAGHCLAFIAADLSGATRGFIIPSALLSPNMMDGIFFLVGIGTGLTAALIPAIAAGRTNIASLLAKARA